MEYTVLSVQERDRILKEAQQLRAQEIRKLASRASHGLHSLFTLSFLRNKQAL